jgi:hypothetical protein
MAPRFNLFACNELREWPESGQAGFFANVFSENPAAII